MASRSMVKTPVEVASAAAWFAAGERRVLCGIAFGSEMMFMAQFYAPCRAGSTVANPALIGPIGQMVVMGEVAKPRHRGVELQFDGTSRTVALFADDDF